MSSDKNDQLDTFEEFEEFGDESFETYDAPPPQSLGAKLSDLWANNAAFKFVTIIGGALVLGGLAYAFMGNNGKPVTPGGDQSRVAGAESVKGNVGADVTPEYRDLLQKENEERAKEALQAGNSAIPTPVGGIAVDDNKPAEQPMDPLALWKQAEQQSQQPQAPAPLLQQQQQVDQQQQQQQQADQQQLDALTGAMQQQISSLMEAWQPKDATVVAFSVADDKNNNASVEDKDGNVTTISSNTTPQEEQARVVVPAGEILYGAMITEANSDVPGPILAQVLSGPLKGGRLIGAFKTTEDFLVLEFSTLSIGGRSYSVNAIALDPNTTLGGVATEVDKRYFARLILPAAASFISRFGDVISEPETTTTVSNGTVVVSQNKQSTRDALFAGAGDAADQLSDFVDEEANKVRPLVRVASNTPIGIFFTQPVTNQTKR